MPNSFRGHARESGHPPTAGAACLGKVVPDSKAGGYWIARRRG
jgi:hypothetical protein